MTTQTAPTTLPGALPATSRLDNIQILRGVAALLVVLGHGAKEIGKNPLFEGSWLQQFAELQFQFGVDIFFVISGFIMFHISRNHMDDRGYPSDFLWRRLIRIAPLYYLVTILTLAVSFSNPQLKYDNALSWPYVVASYLFIPFPQPDNHALQPVLGVGWTLNLEMYFYVTFAIILTIFRRRAFLPLCAFFVVTYALGFLVSENYFVPYVWTRSIILEFLFGILIAKIYSRGVRLPQYIWPVLTIGAAALWILAGAQSGEDYRGLFWGLPAALIVGSVILGTRDHGSYKGWFWRTALSIGNASYSLYLTHLFVMRACSLVFAHFHFLGSAYPAVYLAVFTPLASAIAVLTYSFFELPTNRIGAGWLRNRTMLRRLSSAAE